MTRQPQITRHDDDRDGPMALVERTELDAVRSALRGMVELLEVMQEAGRKYLVPEFEECDRDWYVSRMLWLTDGPAQRQFEQAARDALLTFNERRCGCCGGELGGLFRATSAGCWIRETDDALDH